MPRKTAKYHGGEEPREKAAPEIVAKTVTQFPPAVIARSKQIPESPDYSIFEATPESLYSSLMPDHIPQVPRIRATVPDTASLIDLTAHVGVDTANFMRVFPDASITSVELNPETAKILGRNVAQVAKAHPRKGKIEVVNENGVDFLVGRKEPVDVVYLDPPWGGHSFKQHAVVEITLKDSKGKVWKMSEIALNALERKIAGTVIIKLPPTYPIASLVSDIADKATVSMFPIISHKGVRIVFWLAVVSPGSA